MEQKSDFKSYDSFQKCLTVNYRREQKSEPTPTQAAQSDSSSADYSNLDLSPNTLSQMEPTPIADHGVQVVDKLSLTSSLVNSAFRIVGEREQQALQDWIRLLREASDSKLSPTAPASASSALPHNTSFPIHRQQHQLFADLPSYESSTLQLGIVDESLGLQKAQSVRLMQDLSTSQSSDPQDLQIRPHQNQKWNERYTELCEFHRRFGHSVVPYHYKESTALAWWVKRQRHQYKMKKEGLHSTLTEEREKLLESLDFVWDSHTAIWEMRLQELIEYKVRHGHTSISQSENPKLLVWVKCQRRQYKMFCAGQKSSMTPERINKLNAIGFCWNPRRETGTSGCN
ncbi:helicase domain protein [Nitzschia inconspicua]|uniref:Helicase domain protein n=1 Tax=Nitzschia inconspicua TaxID=303405 RepID=A0A9K3Q0U4_9STRA|nr:helicase domain protein [Nitzschia inconspicua]